MIAIIGAGPAGLAAAKVAAKSGADVVVLDSAPRPGGQYWRHRDVVEGYKSHRAGDYFDSVIASKSVTYIHGAQVWSAVRHKGSITLNYLHEGSEKTITVEKLILATGAYDRSIPFTGWELPGSMTPGAAQALLKGHGVIAGKKILVSGTGPFLLPVAVGLAEAGADVLGIVEAHSPLRWLRSPLALILNPDGTFSDADRALRRGFSWGPQQADGMSQGKLCATPALRAELDALFAKLAAPGVCNPSDQSPIVEGEPTAEQADADHRTVGQRQHDALSAIARSLLGDPKLGQHNGLPVTVIISASLQDLQSKAGVAVTGGGTLVPMADVIRMASHSYHYLTVFDEVSGRTLWLGRTKRIATADQRIVLHGRDRGCSHPGCTVPGYGCQVHHAEKDWADGGKTDVDDLGFACGPHNRLVKRGGWRTRKRRDGSTEWLPPAQLPLIGGVNRFHHADKLARRLRQ